MKIVELDLSRSEIRFSEKNQDGEAIIKLLDKTYGKALQLYCYSKPPIFLLQNNAYVLIARHYAYDILMHGNGKHMKIPAVIVNPDEYEKVRLMETVDLEVLCSGSRAKGAKGNVTPAMLSRRRRKAAMMLCPLCGKILQGPKYRKPEEEGAQKGFYRVTCFGKFNKKSPCDFRAYLSEDEAQLFWANKYPTKLWLQKTPQTCEKCGRESLFIRTRGDGSFFMCAGNFKRDKTCKYRKEVINFGH